MCAPRRNNHPMISWASKAPPPPPSLHFRSLEPELSGQADRLTASNHKQLRFRSSSGKGFKGR